MRSWVIYTAFFMSVNLLNNAAFAYKLSVPIHIIVRSAGPVASMVIGYVYNSKRYTYTQIFAVALLCIGVVVAAIADAGSKGESLDINLGSEDSLYSSVIGFSILGLAMILGAFQGVYADRLYAKYGRDHWREALFYSHALSLPLLFSSFPKWFPQFRELMASPSVLASLPGKLPEAALFSTATTLMPEATPNATHTTLTQSLGRATVSFLEVALTSHPLISQIFSRLPIKVLYLILNALTQYLCIRGVHLLSAKSSSLTVVVVLNIRKLISLMLSVHLFGNVLVSGVLVGAAAVFLGGGIYAYEGARLKKVGDQKRLGKQKAG
jgi:UDP-xylose/UDP-N-acetylglucosamine transporter B4